MRELDAKRCASWARTPNQFGGLRATLYPPQRSEDSEGGQNRPPESTRGKIDVLDVSETSEKGGSRGAGTSLSGAAAHFRRPHSTRRGLQLQVLLRSSSYDPRQGAKQKKSGVKRFGGVHEGEMLLAIARKSLHVTRSALSHSKRRSGRGDA